MEERDDAILLNSLGVTSAKPEDIERNVLEKVIDDAGNSCHDDPKASKHFQTDPRDVDPSSASKKELYVKLKAIEIEINAVASSVEQTETAAKDKKLDAENDGIKDTEEEKETPNQDDTLQRALAADRLRSLKKTRSQLRKQLSGLNKDNLSGGIGDGKVLEDLVKEVPKHKPKLKTSQTSNKKPEKKRKIISYDDDEDFDAILNAASGGLIETERDELIRKGILTPFHKVKGFERRIQQPEPSRLPAEEEMDNRVSASVRKTAQSLAEAAQARPTTKLLDSNEVPKLNAPAHPFHIYGSRTKLQGSANGNEWKNKDVKRKKKRPSAGKKWRKRISHEELMDGIETTPGDPVASGCEEGENIQDGEDEDGEEVSYITLEGGLEIPEAIFSQLFDYQKVGVQWLWELHCQQTGGIIGDEMGLGKTVQVLVFLGSLHFSGLYKPSIIICPVTLLRQWKREANKWYPAFHVEILHDSLNDAAKRKKTTGSDDNDIDDESEDSLDNDYESYTSSKNPRRWDSMIKRVLGSESGMLLTSYEQLRILGGTLLDVKWGYAVLDEGHRIRNPNADITIVCKQLQTVHRIIMTGAPIQNKLTELWSLFDFVFPGKLGVLPVFEAEFAAPIAIGGYANASPLQVSTAYRCAVVLRDLILPYLLRRMKADVNAQLPKKTEHVLFCSLTPEQRSIYSAFLASSEVEQIFDGSRNSLYGIDVMRKICNHPDLLEREQFAGNPDYGNPERSGKMKVISQVLKMWKEQGHRVLLFAQTQQMLDILENFMIANDYSYRRMDGLTAIKQRTALMDEFNDSSDVFIFILTTKVGGLGTNLIGADRVIIFDPDWNPSTDMQARERAWRIGQKRDVIIYRLITRGTIEEKVYHRQIYKHFLTNKILKNPQQRRFFKARDLKDLFTLTDDSTTETSNLFGGISAELNVLGAGNGNQPNEDSPSTSHPHGNVTGNSVTQETSKPDENEESEQNGEKAGEESRFLKSLFEAHGIHSAVDHDAIMNANDTDKLRMDEEANKIAQRAAEALRQSRMLRSREDVSVPTWTGKNGAAGGPSSVRRKFGSSINSQLASKSSADPPPGVVAGASSGKALSSAELLARIRSNQASAMADGLAHQLGSSSGSASRPRPGSSRSGTPPEVLIRQILTFLQQRGGATDSDTIVSHFKDSIPEKDLGLFKSLLKEIATFKKGRDGPVWVLKPEYHD